MNTSSYQSNPTVLESYPPQEYAEYQASGVKRRLHEELLAYIAKKIAAVVKRAAKRAPEESKHESSPPAKLRHLDSVGLSQMPSNQLFAIELGLYSPELGVLPPK